jgi:hypothetical protein
LTKGRDIFAVSRRNLGDLWLMGVLVFQESAEFFVERWLYVCPLDGNTQIDLLFGHSQVLLMQNAQVLRQVRLGDTQQAVARLPSDVRRA